MEITDVFNAVVKDDKPINIAYRLHKSIAAVNKYKYGKTVPSVKTFIQLKELGYDITPLIHLLTADEVG